jgi:hypothetical protein
MSDYPQGVVFHAEDIWAAYAAGAKEARDWGLTVGAGLPDDAIDRACDAYVKLVHAKVRDGGLPRAYAPTLHGQPVGFTHDDVREILESARDCHADYAERRESIAARLAALLPPETP